MPYKNKERQRAYAQRWYAENKERKRAYAQRPENKERKRAYAQRPENKERKRAYRRDLAAVMRRLQLAPDGIAAIVESAKTGRRYIDIAEDWLIGEADVSVIALLHGVVRRRRKALSADSLGARL